MRSRLLRHAATGLAALVVLASCGDTSSPTARSVASTEPASTITASAVPGPSVSPSTTGSTAAPPSSTVAPSAPPPPTACTVPTALTDQDLERMPVTEKVIALTFDGGSGAQGAPSILDTLERRDVPATFFLTGQFVRSFPRTAARIGQEHLVGNHTDTHPDLTTLDAAEITRQVRVAERDIHASTGEDPRRFFRFPFGARDERTIGLLNDLCYVPFRWTVDTLGWKGTSDGQSVSTVQQRVLDGAVPGGIVLMHLGANPEDGSTLDADALPGVIDGLRSAGYRLVGLDTVLPAAP